MKCYQIVSIILILFSYSCKKKIVENNCENSIDSVLTNVNQLAVESNKYIAAYPNSWWEYSNGEKITCTLKELSLFRLESEDNEECQSSYSVFRFIGPFIDGKGNPYFTSGLIDGDHNILQNPVTHTFSKDKEFIKTEYVENLISDSWIVTEDNGAGFSRSTTRKLNQFHSNFTLPNGQAFANVIEIQEAINYTDSSTLFTDKDSVLYYYSKEIGLIMVDFFESTISDIYLMDYFIGPH